MLGPLKGSLAVLVASGASRSRGWLHWNALGVLKTLRAHWLLRPVALGAFGLHAACGKGSPPPPSGDSVTTITIGSAAGRVGGFDLVSSATVLPDDRLAILQPDCVVLVDFVRIRTDTIRRDGEGPGEFRRPVAMGLGAAGRLTVVDGASHVVSLPVDGQNGTTIRNDRVLPNAYWVRSDTFGELFLAEYRIGLQKSPASTIDTLILSRLKPTGAVDTLGTLSTATFQPVLASKGTMALSVMYAPEDAWGVTPAGDIWQLKGIDFHPRWWEHQTQTWREGAPRLWTPVPVAPEDREPLPHNPRNPEFDTILRPTPKFKAPFLEAVASPDGEIWARLSQPHGATSELIVVFPKDGRISDLVLQLPAGRQLVGLSAGFVYLAVEDPDGTWSLERYSRPVVHP